MSDIIQLLPDSVANQIAAGEVIQRPASVIKELVENAVDAGAKHIDVAVVDAGRTSIQVIDDGKGMSETDARLAFERHATSKIRKADDLFDLHTMGFRGEALPSIAAVAQVELKTRQRGEDIGTHLSIAGGKVTGQEPCACPEGSNFMVENLFFNVPARRKFLKSNNTELNNILTAFQRIVLVYPDIVFRLHSNDTELLNLRACGLRQRIVDVFGNRLNQDLLPVKVETSLCGIHGFVGKPESAKKKNAHQYFFVNGRYMRHPYFAKAVMSAFDRLIPQGEQVPFFLYFDISPKDIDVNIHPTKTEIKFENEQAVWQILNAAVKDAVGIFSNATTLDFDTEGKPDIPVFDPDNGASMPKVDFDPQYNPFTASAPSSGGASAFHPSRMGSESFHASQMGSEGFHASRMGNSQSAFADFDTLMSGASSSSFNDVPSSAPDDLFPQEKSAATGAKQVLEEKAPSHYQYKGKYIMTAVKSGLMIVDQHRAHIRILFEQYQKQLEAKKMRAQKVLFPESLELTAQQQVTLGQIMPELQAMGFELTSLGGSTWSVNAMPEGLDGINVMDLLHDLLDGVHATGDEALQKVNDQLALTMARAAAIPYGQVLQNEEMENIVNSLFLCGNVNYTPDGHKILCILKQQEIEQMLGE